MKTSSRKKRDYRKRYKLHTADDENQLYNIRIHVDKGVFKVKHAEKRVKVNQYASVWRPVRARDFAREIEKGNLVLR